MLIDISVDNFFEKKINISGELWGIFVYLHIDYIKQVWKKAGADFYGTISLGILTQKINGCLTNRRLEDTCDS